MDSSIRIYDTVSDAAAKILACLKHVTQPNSTAILTTDSNEGSTLQSFPFTAVSFSNKKRILYCRLYELLLTLLITGSLNYNMSRTYQSQKQVKMQRSV